MIKNYPWNSWLELNYKILSIMEKFLLPKIRKLKKYFFSPFVLKQKNKHERELEIYKVYFYISIHIFCSPFHLG